MADNGQRKPSTVTGRLHFRLVVCITRIGNQMARLEFAILPKRAVACRSGLQPAGPWRPRGKLLCQVDQSSRARPLSSLEHGCRLRNNKHSPVTTVSRTLSGWAQNVDLLVGRGKSFSTLLMSIGRSLGVLANCKRAQPLAGPCLFLFPRLCLVGGLAVASLPGPQHTIDASKPCGHTYVQHGVVPPDFCLIMA